jgi:tripartite-type tricarboxylate transporter receptor subunit TctC
MDRGCFASMDRRRFTLAGALALGGHARAADEPWPQRVITLVVPFSAGPPWPRPASARWRR